MTKNETLASKLSKLDVTARDASILSFVSQYPLRDKRTQKSIENFYHDLSEHMTPDGKNVAEYCLNYEGEYSHAVKVCGDHLINWWRERFSRYEKNLNKKKY